MFIYLILFSITLYFVYWHMFGKRRNLPPGPTPLPIVGNIFHLDFENIHIDLLKLKKIYGPVFTVWLPDPVIVVSDYEVRSGKSPIFRQQNYKISPIFSHSKNIS